ncbi:hypothetical protein Tco_1461724, partial [Tanacetum coccineum]
EPDSPEAAPTLPDYVPGPEEPEQAPLSPDYVPGPEYPEYLAPSDEEVPIEDQPYVVADSPIALSPGYVADLDPEEDPVEDSEDSPVDYPADGGDSDDDDSSDDDEEEEEHLALADSVVAPVVDHVPSSEETEPFGTDESAATPPSPPACHTTARISIRPKAPMPFPSDEEVKRLLALPPPPPSPLISLSPPSAEERLARCLAAPALPSSPLPIVPHPYGSPNYVGESLTAAPRPARGHGIDYGFIGTLDAETSYQRAKEVGYGIIDTWVDPREASKEIAPVTLEGVNTRSVETLIDDRQYHYETARLLDQEALVSREAWAHSMGLSSAVHYELHGYKTHVWTQDHRMDVQDSLIATLTAHVSSLQGHLATALREIRALQAREQARADVLEGTSSSS